MANKFDQKIFKDKTFSGLLEDIYNDSKKKEKTIESLVKELSLQITDPGTATVIVPLITGYLELSVKNSDNLVKMAGIIQRFLNSSNSNDDEGNSLISEREKEQLMRDIKELTSTAGEIEDRIK